MVSKCLTVISFVLFIINNTNICTPGLHGCLPIYNNRKDSGITLPF